MSATRPNLAAVATLWCAACGDNTSARSVLAHIDGNQPTVFATRDGESTWSTPIAVPTPAGVDYKFDVISNTYEIVLACESNGGFQVDDLLRDVADDLEFLLTGCEDAESAARAPQLELVSVTGTMVQAGGVGMEVEQSSSTGPWQYNLTIEPGTYDLLAASSDAIAIWRDQDVTQDVNEPDLDLESAGVPLEPCDVEVDGLELGEELSIFSELKTTSSTLSLNTSRLTHPGVANLKCAPSTILANSDQHLATGHVVTLSYERVATSVIPSPVVLLAVPSGVRFNNQDGASVSWDEFPVDQVHKTELAVSIKRAERSGTVGVLATRNWLLDSGQSSLGFSTDAPGVKPEWIPRTDDQISSRLLLDAQSQNSSALTIVFGQSF